MRTTTFTIMLIMGLYIIPTQTFSASVKFYAYSINEALIQAEQQNKNVFISYEADWCLPCQIMEESVLSEKQVVSILNENFISIKANFDIGEFQEWFGQYNVTSLPTLSILNYQGNELERREGTMKHKDFLRFIQSHIKSKNPVSPKPIEIAAHYTEIPKTPTKQINMQFGAFSKFGNAKKLMQKVNNLLNINAIITKNEADLHRVVYNTSITEENLKELIALARNSKLDFYIKKQ